MFFLAWNIETFTTDENTLFLSFENVIKNPDGVIPSED